MLVTLLSISNADLQVLNRMHITTLSTSTQNVGESDAIFTNDAANLSAHGKVTHTHVLLIA